MAKFVTAKEAASLIKDGMTVAFGGFAAYSGPDEIYAALAERYRKTGHPKMLTGTETVSLGDANAESDNGLNKLAELDGLLDTVIAGHYGYPPKLGRAIGENKIAGFALPLGCMIHLYGAIAAHRPAFITQIGLGTYVDPRVEGCEGNQKAKDQKRNLVEVVNLFGQDLLAYKAFPIDCAIIRGTYADEDGNISMEEEALGDASFDQAAAAHASGGIVIVQVKEIVKRGSLDPKEVRVYKNLVDYVVKCTDPVKYHKQCYAFDFRPEVSGQAVVPTDEIEAMPLSERKIIARRGALELRSGCLINLGIGMPSGVASVANEEGFADKIALSVESGPQGGVPVEGMGFSASVNSEAIYNLADVFNLYDGGFLDMTFLGAAEIDEKGNVNVTKFAGRGMGPGGFIDITQNTPKVNFVGTFTAGGLREEVRDGKLIILQEGRGKKFKKAVEQITFSGDYARAHGQEVRFITERAVLELRPEGLTLTEIAPGMDLQKDILDQMEFMPLISEALKEMDARIFREEKMGIAAEIK